MKTIKITLLSLFLLICVQYVECQELTYSRSSLKYSAGLGMSEGDRTTGLGFLFAAGYEYQFRYDRLWINPNIVIGWYNASLVMDVRDQWSNSISLENNLFFDILRYRAFSVSFGAGVVGTRIVGLLATGGYPPSSTSSEYISEWHYGAYLSGRLKINPPSSRIAFELLTPNIHMGPDYFSEASIRVGMAVKLK